MPYRVFRVLAVLCRAVGGMCVCAVVGEWGRNVSGCGGGGGGVVEGGEVG